MATYAKDTQVRPEKSRAEIEQTLKRYGAHAFGYGYDGDRATIQFVAHDRRIRFDIVVPPEEDFTYTRPGGRGWAPGARHRTAAERRNAREKAERQRWRALALFVKATLEAVEAGIVTFEEAFLAHIMLPNGSTAGDWMAPQLQEVYESGTMPELLPPARALLDAGKS